MKTFTEFAICWLLMWGITYVTTAIFAPGISGDALLGSLLYSIFGAIIIAVIIIRTFINNPIQVAGYYARVGLFILALIEIYAGIISWSGLAVWNVPFPQKELFQISMAFGDLVSAVLMLYLAFFDE